MALVIYHQWNVIIPSQMPGHYYRRHLPLDVAMLECPSLIGLYDLVCFYSYEPFRRVAVPT